MGLRGLDLKDEYRSDRDNIFAEFFFECLGACRRYDRCVDLLSINTLIAISMSFDNFAAGQARMRMVTGHRFRADDLNILGRVFKQTAFEGRRIRSAKLRSLQNAVKKGQIQLKIAIPTSEDVTGSFSERIGIFTDAEGDAVAFTGTSGESFSEGSRDFESVDVFTSWNEPGRVSRKAEDFEDLWENRTRYVEVHDFEEADRRNLLKYSAAWATRH
ncbi:MAG: DNA repair helicase [Nitrosopumilus sp.]|nr:DNA repair helicase [Nitrosopumilus sp.]CAI9832700.1 DNA repair helicase [Nitrosopumilaceae archaeon]MDA7940686.1 DNA repair helicase [Nitrosopumilus sp.]MDA7942894.1 DNA repair helicase [Nitrosopumilus sp.]MDA7944695.1 DNA repair helicase [Nitrosopumilus sp.]